MSKRTPSRRWEETARSRNRWSPVYLEFLEQYQLLSAAPAAPIDLAVRATSSTAIQVAWTDAAADETAFEIQRADFWWGTFTTVATVGANTTAWTDATLSPGAAHQYRVRAVNASGESAWVTGMNSLATTFFPHQARDPFRASTYQQQSGSGMTNYIDGVSTWQDGAWMRFSSFDFSATPITAFTASYIAVDAGNSLEIRLDSPTGTLLGQLAFTPTGDWDTLKSASTSLAAATGVHDVYFVYRTPAWHATNFRTFSFAPNAAPINTVPAAQLVSQDSSLVFSSANGNAISVADPDNDGNVLQITLSVANGKLSLASIDKVRLVSGTGTNDSTVTFRVYYWDVSTALDGLRYTPATGYTGADLLTVTTNDLGFTGSGGPLTATSTVAMNVRAVEPPPSAPTGFGVRADSASELRLTWTDTSTNETGFQIQRLVGKDEYETIATVAANVTTYVDAGLPAGQTHRYRVRAINGSGVSNWTAMGNDTGTTRVAHSLSTMFLAAHYQAQSGPFNNFVEGVSVWTDGGWMMFSDFDLTAAAAFTMAYTGPTGGNLLEIRIGSPTGTLIGQATIPGTGGYNHYATLTTSITPVAGVHDVYLVFRFPMGWSYNLAGFSFGSNAAPVNTVPGQQLVLQNSPLTISSGDGNRLAIQDADNPLEVRVTLSVAHGKLTLKGADSLAFTSGDGSSDATMTFTGPLWAVNSALDGLVYMPDAGFTGEDLLTLVTDDRGFIGAGGALTATSTVSLSVRNSLINPAAPTLPTALPISGTEVELAWVDNSENDTGFEVQRALPGEYGWTSLGVTAPHAESLRDTGLVPGKSYLYRVRAINDTGYSEWVYGEAFAATTRVVHDLSQPFPASTFQYQSNIRLEGRRIAPLVDGACLLFSDFDFSQGTEGFTATSRGAGGIVIEVRLDGPAGALLGFLTLPDTGASSEFLPASAALSSATGLHDVYFVFRNIRPGALISDFSFARNLAPVHYVPVAQITQRGTPLVFSAADGNALRVEDLDNGGSFEKVTLTVSHGALSLAQTEGLTFLTGDGFDDATLVFTGSLEAINAALRRLTYTPASRFSGEDTLTLISDDLGAAGYGGPLATTSTVRLTVSSLDNAPVVLTPAWANPSIVTRGTALLSVVAADDGGAEHLTYTWSLLEGPAGAVVSFSQNGSNAAALTQATLDRAGVYTFLVSIWDGENVTTSTVALTAAASTPPAKVADVVMPAQAATPPVSTAVTHPAAQAASPPTGVTVYPAHLTSAPANVLAQVAFSSGTAGQVAASTGAVAGPVTAPSHTPAAAPAPAPVPPAAPAGAGGTVILPRTLAVTPAPVAAAQAVVEAAVSAPKSVHELFTAPVAVIPQALSLVQQIEDQVVHSAEVQKTVTRVVGTVVSVSATASVGYAIWAARGGSLLMSMLTSVPMWRFIDPLPVLDSGPARRARRRGWRSWFRSESEPLPDSADDQLEHLTD